MPNRNDVPGGYSSVELYNCHPGQNCLIYWNVDRSTTGAAGDVGPIDAMYSETGYCPDPKCRWIVSAQAAACIPALGTASTALSATAGDTLPALGLIGVDFSVSEAELKNWLGNTYTSYPKIAAALLKLLQGQQLRQPVYLDVIVWNYEHAPGGTVPKGTDDVDLGRLRAAVVAGYNSRYGTAVAAFRDLVR